MRLRWKRTLCFTASGTRKNEQGAVPSYSILLMLCSAEGRQLDAVMLARGFVARLQFTDRDPHFAWSVTDEVSRFVKTNHPTREERASSRRSLFSRNEEDPTIRRAAHSRTKLSRTVRHKTRPRIQLSLPQATMWRIGATVSRIGNGR